MHVQTWSRADTDRILSLVAAALPGEDLQDDDVVANLFDDPDPVCILGADDGSGFVAGVVRGQTAHVQLLAVDPSRHRQGIGTALVGAFESWAFDASGPAVTAVVVGAGAPFYLFAGVDVRATAALCLFEALGYRARGAELNLSFASRFRAPTPAGVEVRRVLEEDDVRRTISFVGAHWPNWVAETERGIEHGACHVALSGDDVIAFGCHSVNRLGWLGPIGTDPTRRAAGVGTTLLSVIAKDVMAAGIDTVEVSWIGPIGFYAKAAGASVSRVFRSLAKSRHA